MVFSIEGPDDSYLGKILSPPRVLYIILLYYSSDLNNHAYQIIVPTCQIPENSNSAYWNNSAYIPKYRKTNNSACLQ